METRGGASWRDAREHGTAPRLASTLRPWVGRAWSPTPLRSVEAAALDVTVEHRAHASLDTWTGLTVPAFSGHGRGNEFGRRREHAPACWTQNEAARQEGRSSCPGGRHSPRLLLSARHDHTRRRGFTRGTHRRRGQLCIRLRRRVASSCRSSETSARMAKTCSGGWRCSISASTRRSWGTERHACGAVR